MATKDPNRLFDLLDSLRTNMEAIIEDAQALATEAGGFNGELNKVIKEQVTKYLVPAVEKLINDDQTPGSIIGLEKFLGSVPLAMVREQPTEADVPNDIMPEDVSLTTPAGATVTGNPEIDAIPQRASYAHPEGAVRESQETGMETKFDGGAWKTEGDSKEPQEIAQVNYKGQDFDSDDTDYLQEKFQVVRTSKVGSSVAADQSNLREQVIGEFDSKEEAEAYAESLNNTIGLDEKNFLGTEYKVVESKDYEMQESKGRSMKEVLDEVIAQSKARELKAHGINESTSTQRAKKLTEDNLGKSMKDVLDAMIAEDDPEYDLKKESFKKKQLTEARYYGDDADRVELNISVKGDITVGKKLVGYLKSHGYSRYDIIADDDILDAEDYGEDDPHILVSICDLPMGAIDKVLSKIDESGIEYDDYWEN